MVDLRYLPPAYKHSTVMPTPTNRSGTVVMAGSRHSNA